VQIQPVPTSRTSRSRWASSSRRYGLFSTGLEQRVAERTVEVESARETLAFALDCADMGTWDLDLATDTARRSARHDRIFGYSEPPEAWGRERFMSHVVPEDRPSVEQAFAKATHSGSLEFECRIERHDKAIRWVTVRGRVEYGPNRQPARLAGLIQHPPG
jgi:PAS domain-containing protein